MSLNKTEKEEPQMRPRDRILAGLMAADTERKGKCESLLREIDSVIQRVREGLPKEGAPISFEERKRAQESLASLKEEYARKRGELFRVLDSVEDRGFQALANEHIGQLNKAIEPAVVGRAPSPRELITSGLKAREEKTPGSSIPAKTEIKPPEPDGIFLDAKRCLTNTILEIWKCLDSEITLENFDERRKTIIERLNAVQVGKKGTDGNGSGGSDG